MERRVTIYPRAGEVLNQYFYYEIYTPQNPYNHRRFNTGVYALHDCLLLHFNLFVMETLSIQTLPIEIHVMKVGNRQMTKNIFKQMPLVDFSDFVKDILGVGTDQYKLIGFVKYTPEPSDYLRTCIDRVSIVEAHLLYYDAMDILKDPDGNYHAIDSCWDHSEYLQRMRIFFSKEKRTNGIQVPTLKKDNWGYECHQMYVSTGLPISVILIDNHKQNICRGYMPKDYLQVFNIPQIYIAT